MLLGRGSVFAPIGIAFSTLGLLAMISEAVSWRRRAAEATVRTEFLEAINREFTDRLSLNDVLDRGVRQFAELVRAPQALAVIRRSENEEFDIAADWRTSAEILGNGVVGLIDPKVLDSIVRSGRTVIVDLRERRFAGDSLLAAGSDWVWIAPFKAGVLDGALLAAGSGSDDVTPDPMLTKALMHDVSRAADTALMYETEAERARLMSALADFGSIAASLGDETNARQAAITALKRLFPEEGGYMTSLDVSSGRLNVTQVFGGRGDGVETLEKLIATEECDSAQGCRAISRGGVYLGLGNDGLWDCPYRKSEDIAATFACVPIAGTSEALGAIHVARTSRRSFAEDEMEVLSALGSQLGLALSNARLLQATKEQAVRDPMTGLFNYRFLVEFLANQVAAARRDKKPVSALMLDIDHFRDFNNNHGHAAGDHVLRILARILEKHVRASDLAARYGGEEFTVVLPGTGSSGAMLVGENIRADVAETSLVFGGRDLGSLRVSVGVATMPDHAKTPDELLKGADDALYTAKREGRNMVKSA